jgi:hypothetical protein
VVNNKGLGNCRGLFIFYKRNSNRLQAIFKDEGGKHMDSNKKIETEKNKKEVITKPSSATDSKVTVATKERPRRGWQKKLEAELAKLDVILLRVAITFVMAFDLTIFLASKIMENN